MSISDKRLLANRANGAKSRGPVTVRGKLNSQRARLRHAILSKTLVFPGEDPELFDQILTSLRREFAPETEFELNLIEKMAACQWRELRIWALEKATFTSEMRRQIEKTPSLVAEDESTQAAAAFRRLADTSHALELLNRYESRFDRQHARAFRRLMSVRAERAVASEPVLRAA